MIQYISQERRMEALYLELQPQLLRILTRNLEAPEWVIAEACQAAWGLLVPQGSEVAAGQELGWLSTTATRTAIRILRRERFSEPHAELPEPVRLDDRRAGGSDPERAVELRERLAEIKRLPVREQRVVMLYGFGYAYQEIAAVTGDSRRTVERQLTRARQRLAQLAEEA
jgi:RNA polymerase sigma factor (sigma-70 family)